MIRSPQTLAKYLGPELSGAIKALSLAELFKLSDLKLSLSPNQVAAILRRYDIAKKVRHIHGQAGEWQLTGKGQDLVRYLNGIPKPEKPKPGRLPKYVFQVKGILAQGPASKGAMARELEIYPSQLTGSLRYLQQKRIARHIGEGPASRWELVTS